MVHDVVRIGMELERKPLGDAEFLLQRQIHLGETGTRVIVAARVAEGSGRGGGERGRIQELPG